MELVEDINKLHNAGNCIGDSGKLIRAKGGGRYFRDGSSLICKEGVQCPLSLAVCNATIPTLPLFEMAESANSPFGYVLHFLFIKFISTFHQACVTGQLP